MRPLSLGPLSHKQANRGMQGHHSELLLPPRAAEACTLSPAAPSFPFTSRSAGTVTLPEGTEMVMPGDNVTCTFELLHPVAMEPGLRCVSSRARGGACCAWARGGAWAHGGMQGHISVELQAHGGIGTYYLQRRCAHWAHTSSGAG